MARIVIIDDQEPIRRLARRILEREGHRVMDASDGEMGLQIVVRHGADLVITDIFMPGQDGIVTLLELRKKYPNLKVIVISGGDTTGRLDLRQDAVALGAVQSLPKPFTADELIQVVRATLNPEAGR